MWNRSIEVRTFSPLEFQILQFYFLRTGESYNVRPIDLKYEVKKSRVYSIFFLQLNRKTGKFLNDFFFGTGS